MPIAERAGSGDPPTATPLPAAILAISYHLPEGIETNEDLERENPDWLMGKLYRKLGIGARRVAGRDEFASDLACRAAEKLFEQGSADPDQIDYLLYCTQSPDYYLPSGACILQDRLGLPDTCGALDFNLGCSGFVYGLQLACSLITAGQARRVLLLTADTYSKYIHPRDRTVRTLFGDGAAATLLGPAGDTGGQIGPFVVGTRGSGAENLIVPAGGLRQPRSPATAIEHQDANNCTRSQNDLYMNGRAIFTFAVSTVPPTIEALLTRSKLSPGEIDWFVYHQANRFMLASLADRSDLPMEKVLLEMDDVGNTVSASIPIALARARADGRVAPGQRLMLIGFGVGYSWGACMATWAY